MAQGILTAILVTLVWVFGHIGLMQFRPAENRIGSMTRGYLISLPFVFIVYRWFPWPAALAAAGAHEAWLMGLLHAYFGHLLLYFFYCEGFYHVERAVTTRLLIEIMNYPGGARIEDIQKDYNVKEMIRARLEVLRDHQFIEESNGAWRLKSKGLFFARAMQISAWIFQSKGQADRE